jgi:hypothetical protein
MRAALRIIVLLLGLGAVALVAVWLRRPPHRAALPRDEASGAESSAAAREESASTAAPPTPEAVPTLSYFEPHAGGCAWYRRRLDDDESEQLGVFPCDCANVQWSLGADGRKAVVWFDTETYGSQDELVFLVDLERKTHTRLALPEDLGDGVTYALTDDGQVMALLMNDEIEIDATGPAPRLRHGRDSYAPLSSAEGTDVLAHAAELRGARWQLLETKPSRCCAADAPGVSVLAAHRRLFSGAAAARQSQSVLAEHGDYAKLADADVSRKLAARLPQELESEAPSWQVAASKDWPWTLAFRGGGDDRRAPTGFAYLIKGKDVQPLPELPFAATDLVRLEPRGPWLLLTEARTGMRPHVYDMRTGALVIGDKLAHGAAFWPAASAP